MGWNKILKPEKGLLAGQPFVTGDITGNITFSNYSDNVNSIPTVSQDEQNHRIQEYVGWTPENSFNWIVSNLDSTHKLIAAFRLTPIDITHPGAGTFICAKMWARDIQNTSSRKSAYIGCEWSKRVYTDNINYTESYPLGNYWPDGEYNFTPSSEFPGRSAETIAIFLKTGYFDLVQNVVGGFAIGWRNGYASCYSSGCAFRAKNSWFKSAAGFGVDAEIPDVAESSPEFGKAAQPGGGYNENSEHKGSFDDSSDQITLSSIPSTSVLGTNMVHAYKVNDTILNQFADAMYPDYVFSNTSIEDALAGIYNAIFFSKYVDFMLDLVILPIEVPAPNLVHIKVGGKYVKTANDAFIDAPMVQQQYVEVDLGTLAIEEYWANFLDFAGTRVKLFLPYVGFVDLQPEYVIGGEIGVKYRFNVLDGSFMAYVRSTSGHSELEESLIAQYSGVAAVHIPLQAADYSQKVSGLISAIGGVAAGVAGSGVMGAIAAHGVANAANTLIQKPGSSHANGYNASSSFLSHRTPYLIIERQTSQFSEKYPEEVGLPLNVAMRLGDCEGLTIASTAHLDTIPATREEKNLISQYLKEGIII